MKKFLSLILLSALLLTFTSCFKSEKKYDYDMTEYVTLPDYSNYTVEVKLDDLQQTIDNTILSNSTIVYKPKKGDNVYFTIKAYEHTIIGQDAGNEVDKKGDEILELRKDSVYIEDIGSGKVDKVIEDKILDLGIAFGQSKEIIFTFPNDYSNEAYRGKKVYLEMSFLNMACRKGDVVSVDYTGYFIDENENIIVENGQNKTFDSGSLKAYIGSRLAINDFEEGIVGMLAGEDNKKIFTATFPEDYASADVKGKKVKFEVTIKSYFNVPVYNNDFVKSYFGEYESVADFEEQAITQYANQKFLEYVLINSQIINYPKGEYKELEKMLEELELNYAGQGVSLDSLIKSEYNMTRDEYIKMSMKPEMIYYALAQKEAVTPTEQDLANAREVIILMQKESYMKQNKTATEENATKYATDYVDSNPNAVYDEALFKCVENKLYTMTKISKITKSYNSITNTIASALQNQ